MQRDYSLWAARQAAKVKPATETWEGVRSAVLDQIKALPETVTVPYHLTEEGVRLERFRKACEPEFLMRINRDSLNNAPAFDRVALWDGSFPGPLAVGATGTAKTRAGWSAIGRLYVKNTKGFRFFTAKRLLLRLAEAEQRNLLDDFQRQHSPPHYSVLMVDDADKINWQFESEASALFQFYDWVYRARICCITTTNRPREWWMDHAGAPLVRRMFDEAHFEVKF